MNRSSVTGNARLLKFAFSLFFALMVMGASVHAAVETNDSAEQRNRVKQEALDRERQLLAPRVDLQGNIIIPAAAEMLPVETPCFKIDKFVLEVPDNLALKTRLLGASTLPQDRFRFAQDYLETFAGRCIGRGGVNFIVKNLTGRIIGRGYTTTRLGIPGQDMSVGMLKLTLIPGIIHEIRYADAVAAGRFNAFPVKAGDLLNLRDLEQALEQMKRPTSQDVDLQIVPAGTLGESDVVIAVKHTKSWRAVVTLDDSGAQGTGKLQAGLTLGWDNLFNASDVFNIGVNSDADRNSYARGTQGYNASYSIPFGYLTLTLSANDYEYHQRVIGTYQNFVSSGKAQNLESKIGYLLYRDQNQKDSLQFRTGRRWSHSYIDDTEIIVQYGNFSFAELAYNHKHYFGQAQLDITGAYRWGTPWFGAQSDPANLANGGAKLDYQLETIDATLNIPFKILNRLMSYTATFRAQTSNSALYASEWFTIGNRWTVRGFDGENTLAAEKGIFLRNEINIPIVDTAQLAYIGVDFGKVYGPNAANLIGNRLAGCAFGMRGGLAKGVSYEVFAGFSLYKPQGLNTSEPATGFNLVYQI
ncbi:MAG: ShlB/FhaC/HecB family hemolysin secretion/activation protein [Gallionella sp.]